MSKYGIFLEIGQAKNVNKNAVAEKCIRELREQLVCLSPHGGPVLEVTLAKDMNNLNCLIRHMERSAKELFFLEISLLVLTFVWTIMIWQIFSLEFTSLLTFHRQDMRPDTHRNQWSYWR